MSVTELLTLLWLLVAFLTWLLTHLKSKKDQKVSNTIQIINNLSTVHHLLDADLKIRNELRSNNDFKLNEINEEVEERLVTILDYYEFLARLYWEGSADKASIEHLRGGLILELYKASSEYIQHLREQLGRPDLYEQLEKLTKEIASNKAIKSDS